MVLLSASRALSPRPLFLASTLRATKHGGQAGIECAIGQTLVEFPLVIGLTVGLQTFVQSLTDLIAISGGIVLLAFSSVQLLQVSRPIELDSEKAPEHLGQETGNNRWAGFHGSQPVLHSVVGDCWGSTYKPGPGTGCSRGSNSNVCGSCLDGLCLAGRNSNPRGTRKVCPGNTVSSSTGGFQHSDDLFRHLFHVSAIV